MNSFPVARLGDVTSLISSGATPLGGSDVYLDVGPVLFIRSQNVLMNRLLLDEAVYISQEMDARLARTRVREGDVLLNITGASIGRVTQFKGQNFPANVNQHVCVIRPRPKIDGGFLTWYLGSPHMQSCINRAQSGGTRQALTIAKIADFQIPLPPLDEQRRIAAILDQADALRAKRQIAVRLLDKLAQSAFEIYFSRDIVPTLPQKPLGAVAEIVSGVTVGRKLNAGQSRQVPYLAVLNVQDKRLNLSTVKWIQATEAEISRYRLRSSDLLLTEGGDPDKLGRGTLWNSELPECIHQNHVFRVRLQTQAVHPLFLEWFVGSSYGKQYFLRSAKQTTGIASINLTQLKNFPLAVPPIEDQERFVKQIYAIQRMKAEQMESARVIDELLSSLQNQAFQGNL